MTLYFSSVFDVVAKKCLKMSLVKVSVENMDNTDRVLHEINKGESFEENIKDICELFGKHYSPKVFGLKLLSTNDGKALHTYISSDNFDDIKDGYFLKLCYSLSYYVKRIFDHIDDEYKERSFEDLYDLSMDPEFVKEMVKNEKHLTIIDTFSNNPDLAEKEVTACLIAIVHLLLKQYVGEIDANFINKVILIIKQSRNSEQVKYALSVIHKILCYRSANFAKWKEEIIKQITITDLINLVKKKYSSEVDYATLLVINTIIRSCKGEKRQQLIKEINQKGVRETISQHIVSNANVDKVTARELYMYQTHLLSIYEETLNSTISNDGNFLQDEFELVDNEIKKMTLLMDFEESGSKNKTASFDNLIEHDDVRISLASISSKLSGDSRYSNRILSTGTNDGTDYEHVKPSLLAIEALRHYKQFHFKNFHQSQIEERVYEPGILASSERVVQMLAKILRIGMEPDRSSECYQPTIFTCSSRTPFFFELFSRTMWLLSKTRREMKASTKFDYDKVIHVLAKQVRLALDQKPMDFKKLTDKMAETSYETVLKIWQNENEAEMKDVLENNPCVKVLRERFSQHNEQLICEQRMNYVKNGTIFPKFNDKKINGNFRAKLSNNGRHLLINDYNAVTKTSGEAKSYPIEDITHLVQGKACPLVQNNSVKDPQLAFSIILNNQEWINFKAADRKIANYWCDALNLLLGKDNLSSYYQNELKNLDEMDLVLHLIELQNAKIPKKPPPIPRLPAETKPPIPPKPKSYRTSQ